jgi:tetratricopeptide (TPR) repeat protein
MASGAVAEAAHLYQLVTDNDTDAVRTADATAACARAFNLTRDMTRANPLLELGATRLRAVGKVSEAIRLEIKRVEGLAGVGAVSLNNLLEQLFLVKAEARDRADWEAVALALDAELHLLHRAGDLSGICHVFGEMRDVSRMGSIEAELLANAGLALGVLFGDPNEALSAARQAVGLTVEGRSYRLKALLRLMVVLQYRGMLEMPDSRQVIHEARETAAKSGDVLLHFSIENNLAVAALDAGDLDRADALMARAQSLAGSADMDLYRFIQSNNAAELAIAQREIRRAAECYTEALTYSGATTPSYLMDLVTAGLGLCAVETGNLTEARRREEELREPPEMWYYDPSTILAFRARFLQRTGRTDKAIELLETEANRIENRLMLAWLKVRALQVRLLLREDAHLGRRLAEDCLARAEHLNLRARVSEFSMLLGSKCT